MTEKTAHWDFRINSSSYVTIKCSLRPTYRWLKGAYHDHKKVDSGYFYCIYSVHNGFADVGLPKTSKTKQGWAQREIFQRICATLFVCGISFIVWNHTIHCRIICHILRGNRSSFFDETKNNGAVFSAICHEAGNRTTDHCRFFGQRHEQSSASPTGLTDI